MNTFTLGACFQHELHTEHICSQTKTAVVLAEPVLSACKPFPLMRLVTRGLLCSLEEFLKTHPAVFLLVW